MRSRRTALGFIAALCLAFAPLAAQADRIVVFAAASTKTALDIVAAGFEAASGHQVIVSAAGSSALARQIQQGAPADLFLSANPDWMDVLQAGGLIAPGTRRDLLGNTLVLVAHDASAGPVDLTSGAEIVARLGAGRLAMALVKAVPAGLYGKAALTHLGIWDTLAPQVAQTDNVRAALALVATGAAPYGIVYGSDAAAEPRVALVGTFAADSHAPIIYPVAAIAGRVTPAVTAFLGYLLGAAAQTVFEAQGFRTVED